MSRHQANLPSLSVATGGSASVTAITKYLDDAIAITIGAPATLTATHLIQGSIDGGTTWHTIQSGGSDVSITQGEAVVVSPFPFNALRTNCGASTEAAERTFTVLKQFEVNR